MAMPKTRPKTSPKKTKPKMKSKVQPKPVSITSSKTYWITLTLVMVVFGSVYGYIMKVAVAAIGLLLATVLVLIGFAFYLKFKQSTQNNRSRATFIFSGASIIGFLIWVAVVLVLVATGSWVQIEASIGDNFFAVTSMIISLTSGAIIGDILCENKEKISFFLRSKFSR
jgi:cation transport ATPase